MTATSRTLHHVGEWKVELRASTLEELFIQLARTLARAGGPCSEEPSGTAWERVELDAQDHATLLADWANELIGRSEAAVLTYQDVRHLVINRRPDGAVQLTADIRGAPVAEWRSPVKAATYHDASVSRVANEWRAVILLDV